MRWVFYLKDSQLDADDRKQWEFEYEDYCKDFNKNSKYVTAHTAFPNSVAREAEDTYTDDQTYVIIGVCLSLLYSVFVLAQLNTVKSRALIGLMGVASDALAFIEAISFGALVGIDGTSLNNALPFLLLCVGINDMFVLVASLH